MQHSIRTVFTVTALIALATASLTACASSPEDAASGGSVNGTSSESQAGSAPTPDTPTAEPNSETPGGGTAVLTYGDTTYTAKLQFCALTEGADALLHGPAFDSDGSEVGYFGADFVNLGDAPHGEARINFGASSKLQSTDEFVTLGDGMGHIVVTDSTDESLIVIGSTWQQDGAELPTGTLKVTC